MGLDLALGLLRCPHCAEPFVRHAGAIRCAHGHQFDVARQGHLNLLGSAPPANADTAEMVAARLRFLDAGHYQPIVDALRGTIEDTARWWLDVGAGPGWYLAQLLDTSPTAVGLACDVSVAAARRAARAHPRAGAVVFDTWRPWPVGSGVADLVLAVFAPRNAAEFTRVLRPGGHLVVVTPDPDHLAEVRAVHHLLDVGTDKLGRLSDTLGAEFELTSSQQVRHRLDLEDGAVRDLIAMGPNAFHQRPEQTTALSTTLSVTVSNWRRRPRTP